MAEWSKAPDSSVQTYLREYVSGVGFSGPRMWAWVRIPLLTQELFRSLSGLSAFTNVARFKSTSKGGRTLDHR